LIEKSVEEIGNKVKYLQYNSKKQSRLQRQRHPRTSPHVYNLSDVPQTPQNRLVECSSVELEFILRHFAGIDFPRRISTRTTEGRQTLVNDKPEALARFKQANYLDCRVSAYTELDDTPNFIFIDIDSLDFTVIEKVLNKYREFEWVPTGLFTGSGYHIYQPVTPIRLDDISDFSGYRDTDLSKQFLKFATEYFSVDKADANHNPSLKSCMVRIPGSINSKNGEKVRVVQEWDGKRPSIIPLLGIFYSWLATKKITEQSKVNRYNYYKIGRRPRSNSIPWIESLLKTPLDDYRKTIVNLVLAPYLMNIRQLQYDEAFTIIKSWLELCTAQRKLDFSANYLANTALVNAKKSNYKPMRLDTLKNRNSTVYKILAAK
jgi:hypothetical protein